MIQFSVRTTGVRTGWQSARADWSLELNQALGGGVGGAVPSRALSCESLRLADAAGFGAAFLPASIAMLDA
ncbi:hypothetical protein [Woeseia oceani]|uniref:hypothetical protein n=1 Tax=Woeseia oceani TaxID=1548547 RepID=UPI0012E9D4D4|nr:hypothetical protein [Woeseia oceani]